MIEADLRKRLQPLARQHYGGCDEIGVEPRLHRISQNLFKIAAQRRLAAGKMQLQRANRRRASKRLAPFGGGKLDIGALELDRVGAIRALQRAAMSQFREQSRRTAGEWLVGASLRGHGRRRENVRTVAQQTFVREPLQQRLNVARHNVQRRGKLRRQPRGDAADRRHPVDHA